MKVVSAEETVTTSPQSSLLTMGACDVHARKMLTRGIRRIHKCRGRARRDAPHCGAAAAAISATAAPTKSAQCSKSGKSADFPGLH